MSNGAYDTDMRYNYHSFFVKHFVTSELYCAVSTLYSFEKTNSKVQYKMCFISFQIIKFLCMSVK